MIDGKIENRESHSERVRRSWQARRANPGDGSITHGSAPRSGRSKTYRSWQHARTRCSDPGSNKYGDYGGRGITVCDRWQKFENFLADMGERPEGMTLDRIDVNGNYEPGNCRWATHREQAQNTTRNLMFEFRGERLCLTQIARLSGMSFGSLYYRMTHGWSLDQATSVPLGSRRSVANLGAAKTPPSIEQPHQSKIPTQPQGEGS